VARAFERWLRNLPKLPGGNVESDDLSGDFFDFASPSSFCSIECRRFPFLGSFGLGGGLRFFLNEVEVVSSPDGMVVVDGKEEELVEEDSVESKEDEETVDESDSGAENGDGPQNGEEDDEDEDVDNAGDNNDDNGDDEDPVDRDDDAEEEREEEGNDEACEKGVGNAEKGDDASTGEVDRLRFALRRDCAVAPSRLLACPFRCVARRLMALGRGPPAS